MSRKGALLLAGLLLAATLMIFELTSLDLWLQDAFFSFDQQTWLVSKKARGSRILFYHGPKLLLIGFGAWLLASLAFRKPSKLRRFLSCRTPRELVYLMICLGLFPALIGGLKKISGLHCPSELSRYGGEHEFRRLFSPRPANSQELGHCFPAGHASGGFALLGLYFVARTNLEKKGGLFVGLGLGWAMGLYQMLNGAHFLSHTLVTMILAWIFTLSFAGLLRLPENLRHQESEVRSRST